MDNEKIFKDANGRQVILFPADYKETSFDALLSEYNEKKYVTWELPENGAKDIREGDICYIYYTNLPNFKNGNNNPNRILFRAIVIGKPKEMTCEEIYFDKAEEPHKIVIGFSIDSLQPVELLNPTKYALDNLRNKYNINHPIRSVTRLQAVSKVLYDDIENDTLKYRMEGLQVYF